MRNLPSKDILSIGWVTEWFLGLLQEKVHFISSLPVSPLLSRQLSPGARLRVSCSFPMKLFINMKKCSGKQSLPLHISQGSTLTLALPPHCLADTPQGPVNENLWCFSENRTDWIQSPSSAPKSLLFAPSCFHKVAPVVCLWLHQRLSPPRSQVTW